MIQRALLSLVLSGLGRDALKVATGLLVAVLLALAFAIASVMALFYSVAPSHEVASARVDKIPPDQLFAYTSADWYADRDVAVAVRYRDGHIAPGAPSSQVIDLARAQIGRPYVGGGADPRTSFDCSGLVQWAYRQVGAGLPRTAQQQFDATLRVPRDQLEPGDLVFFHPLPHKWITHVGIYVGSGLMVNAPTEGDDIREMPVFTGVWGGHFAGAGRVRG